MTSNLKVVLQLVLLPRTTLNSSVGLFWTTKVPPGPVHPAPVAAVMITRAVVIVPLLVAMKTRQIEPAPVLFGHVAESVQLGVGADVPAAYAALDGEGTILALLIEGVSVNL